MDGHGASFWSSPTPIVMGRVLPAFQRPEAGPDSPGSIQHPSAQCNDHPHGFDDPERPCTLEKTVDRAEAASDRKSQNEPMASPLEGVANHHGRNREESKCSKRIHFTETLQHRRCSLCRLYGDAPILHACRARCAESKGAGNEAKDTGWKERRVPERPLPAVGPGLRAAVRCSPCWCICWTARRTEQDFYGAFTFRP